jgi:hypothetical protein
MTISLVGIVAFLGVAQGCNRYSLEEGDECDDSALFASFCRPGLMCSSDGAWGKCIKAPPVDQGGDVPPDYCTASPQACCTMYPGLCWDVSPDASAEDAGSSEPDAGGPDGSAGGEQPDGSDDGGSNDGD